MPLELKDLRYLVRVLGKNGAAMGISASDIVTNEILNLAHSMKLEVAHQHERSDLIQLVVEGVAKKKILPLDELTRMNYDEILDHFNDVAPSNNDLIALMTELGYRVSAEDKKHLKRSVARQLSETALFTSVASKPRSSP